MTRPLRREVIRPGYPLPAYPQSVHGLLRAASGPDGSDMMWCIISAEVPRDEFKREYPDANASSMANWPSSAGDNSLQWLTVDSVRVAEYYRIETKPAKLCMLVMGRSHGRTRSRKVRRSPSSKKRDNNKRVVMWRKCTGVDVLEEREIPGRFIPVFPVYGDEVDLDNRVIRSGVVRWAKDPAAHVQLLDDGATEEVSLRPKTPFHRGRGTVRGIRNAMGSGQ